MRNGGVTNRYAEYITPILYTKGFYIRTLSTFGLPGVTHRYAKETFDRYPLRTP